MGSRRAFRCAGTTELMKAVERQNMDVFGEVRKAMELTDAQVRLVFVDIVAEAHLFSEYRRRVWRCRMYLPAIVYRRS